MKQYAVLRVYGAINPSVIFTTNSYEDALGMAQIMSRQDKYEYAVVKAMNSFRTVEE